MYLRFEFHRFRYHFLWCGRASHRSLVISSGAQPCLSSAGVELSLPASAHAQPGGVCTPPAELRRTQHYHSAQSCRPALRGCPAPERGSKRGRQHAGKTWELPVGLQYRSGRCSPCFAWLPRWFAGPGRFTGSRRSRPLRCLGIEGRPLARHRPGPEEGQSGGSGQGLWV